MLEIIKRALASLKESCGLFYVLPAILSVGIGAYTYFVDKDINIFGDVVGPIGIFSALMFSVIFIVVEHFLKRKVDFNSDNDEDKRYLETYQDFTRNTVSRIAFSIFHAGWIIILVFVLPRIKVENIWWQIGKNVVFTFFLIQYVSLIIIVVKDMYAMLIEDTEPKK